MASGMRSGEFWVALVERAVRAGASSVLSLWLVGEQMMNAFTVNWAEAGGIFLGGAAVSSLMSIVASGVTDTPGPSFTGSEKLNPAGPP
jgi:hypothetical protein